MYKLLCDVSNVNLSKEYGHNIPRGEILDLPEEAAERLVRIGAAIAVVIGIDPAAPDEDQKQDPAPPDYDPELLIKDLPDDLEQLKDIASQHDIQFAANIGAATLKERIETFLRGE